MWQVRVPKIETLTAHALRPPAAGDTRGNLWAPRVTRLRRSQRGTEVPRVSDPVLDPTREAY